MKKSFRIDGMHCQSCVKKLTQAFEDIDGVDDAEVHLDEHRATLTLDEQVTEATLKKAASDAGDYQLDFSNHIADDASDHSSEPETDTSTHHHPSSGSGSDASETSDTEPESIYPLFLIVAYLLGGVILIAMARDEWSVMPIMQHFMAGFFLVFSFFKLLDLPGFVSAYRGYDLLAKRSATWAWLYPFVELGLGIAYLLAIYPLVINAFVLVLMLIGAVGVLQALLDKRAIRCACLGTALNLPMTKVTLIEDLTMAGMAATMLLMLI